jgi:prepilin-type N-terminal cleavage/methylation domain-containing protein/prepilin-type processing-associated H-X9-DG protein
MKRISRTAKTLDLPVPEGKITRQGFTLIELLVVIAIIAILAAILFPVFARARENARRASCQSNLKQIALGTMQYIQDYDEKYPIFYDYNLAVGVPILLQPYLKSMQIFQCPSEKDPITSGSDYAYSGQLGYDENASGAAVARGLSVATLTQSARTIMFCDALGWNPHSGYSRTQGCSTGVCGGIPAGLADFSESLSQDPTPAKRHLDGQNFAFCDGHVKWYVAASDTKSAKVYNGSTTDANTPASASSPTFNATP